MTGRGINAASGQQHTVTDRGHLQPAGEGVDDQALQRLAIDVGAHAAGAMAAGQQQASMPSSVAPAQLDGFWYSGELSIS